MKYVYEHMEELEGVVFPDFTEYNGNLILYGAGINGALCAFALKELGVEFLCFCDSNPSKQGTEYIGYPVFSPLECSRRYPKAAILLDVYCSGKSMKDLALLGYETILFPASLFIGLDCDRAAEFITEQLGHGDDGYMFRDEVDALQVFEWIDEYMIRGVGYITQKHEISRMINLDITDRCTLRCKHCLALKPYFTERNEMPWEEMEQVLGRLTATKWFRRFHILGGEPFLYPHLNKVVEYLCAVPEVEHINIISNGTVIPKEEYIKTLQNPKVMVRISHYGVLSNKCDELLQMCHRYGIEIRVHAQRWQDIGRALEQASGEEETKMRYNECSQREGSFFYVLHGKITLCPFSANTNALGLHKADDGDCFNILKTSSTKELMDKLYTLYWREQPLSACQFCNGWLPYVTKPVPVAEQYEKNEQPKFTIR